MQMDDKKLDYLKGKKSKWYGSIKNLTIYPILILLFIIIVQQSTAEFGKLLSSSVNTSPVQSHVFNAQEQFAIMGVAYFEWKPLIRKIRQS